MLLLKRMSFIFAAVFAALALISPAAAEGLKMPYVVSLYNESNGLPTGEANAVLQTSDGYIWIGSYGGLIRYDGSTFRNFSMEGAISSSSIRGLFEDSSGRLWIGTNDAGAFVRENGVISPVAREDESAFLCVRDFTEGPDGTVYAASNSGVGMISDGVLKPLSGEHALGDVTYSVDCDSKGRIWAALNSGLIAVFGNGAEIAAFTSSDFFEEDSAYCTGSDSSGNIWIGSSGSALAKLSFPDDDVHNFKAEIITVDGVTTHNAIRSGPGGSVIVCGNIGSCIIKSDGSADVISEDDNAASVNSGCVDGEGNVWLASSSYGIIKYTRGCFDSPNKKAGLDGVPLNAVTKQGGFYFLGTDGGILAFDSDWNPVENAITSLYSGVRVRSLAADSKGNVWAATYANTDSVACFNPSTGELKTFDTSNGLLSTGARTVYELSDGGIAVGTKEGLNIIRGGVVTESYSADDGLETSTVLCTAEGRDGSIIVGSDGGGLYKIKDGKVESFFYDDGLEDGVVLRILEDTESEDGFFISAGSSLYYWSEGKFRKLELKKGAGSIFEFYLRGGRLWILQNNGIMSFDREKLLSGEEQIPESYSFEQGLTGSLNANTWNWVDPDGGSLYLATRSGVSIFGFGGLPEINPKGIINSAVIDGEELLNPQSLSLKQDAGRVTVDFSVLSYSGSPNLGISYILEGFDREETVLVGEKTAEVSYTNLPGGEYTFRISVYDPDNPKNRAEYVLPIVKDKKPLEHPWVIAGIGAAGIIVVICAVELVLRAKIRAMRRRQSEYRSIIEQSLQTFARAIDAKDRYTNGHSLRVAEYSRELAKRLGMSEHECENVYYIALLHDIGKIGIPDSILNKPGKLTDEELAMIRRHPLIGGEILKEFTAIDGIADGAKYHHERIDGKGYNAGLKGDEIPVIARIIGVADTYDAMSSNRCYRPALTEEYIINELKRVSGTQLDSKIVPHMLEMIDEGVAPLPADMHKSASAISAHYHNDL